MHANDAAAHRRKGAGRWALIGLLAAGGCGSEAASAPPSTPVAEVARPERPVSSGAAPEPPPPKLPVIDERRVGPLEIDAPLPPSLLGESLPSRYHARLYADAQPLEGFVFERPPLFAAVRGGPYHPYGMESPGEPVPAEMPAEAAARARAGKLKVYMLVITDPALRTAEGLGVGSTHAEAKERYAELDTFTLPGLWEEPSCLAKPHPESTIHFFFASCRSGDETERIEPAEKVIRVVVTDAGKN